MRNYSDPIAVVILAAGAARRFGSTKQLANFRGDPMLLSVIKKVMALNIKPYIALGCEKEIIMNGLNLDLNLVNIIPVQNWERGLAQTIKESLVYFQGQKLSGVLFLLGDQPLISDEYLQAMMGRVLLNPDSLIGTCYDSSKGLKGVPAYFPVNYFDELKALNGEQGGKSILMAYDAETVSFSCDLLDVDEPEDLARAGLID